MQILKILGLGTLFLFLISLALAVIGALQVTHQSTADAVGLSALMGGALEALFSPYLWLAVLVAYGSAFWFIKRHA